MSARVLFILSMAALLKAAIDMAIIYLVAHFVRR